MMSGEELGGDPRLGRIVRRYRHRPVKPGDRRAPIPGARHGADARDPVASRVPAQECRAQHREGAIGPLVRGALRRLELHCKAYACGPAIFPSSRAELDAICTSRAARTAEARDERERIIARLVARPSYRSSVRAERLRPRELTVLCYHRIVDGDDGAASVYRVVGLRAGWRCSGEIACSRIGEASVARSRGARGASSGRVAHISSPPSARSGSATR